jgi:broad specificity phosphatase PhoE
MIVWTSTMRRTIQTAQHLTRKPRAWRALDEIDAGICDGMTYEQIEADMPDVHTGARRRQVPLPLPARRVLRRRDPAPRSA